jgi:ATP-binding cassette subfamily G (WHITE) protein 2 (SNQ2)
MNTEEELFYPTLTVGKTLDFATRLNIPNTLPTNTSSPEEYRRKFKEFLLESLNISHTQDTKIGDAFIGGVSGGERKRVSIIETLAS